MLFYMFASLQKFFARILLVAMIVNIFAPLNSLYATPTWTVSYSSTTATNQNVVATVNISE
jgi:hypothetical protein